jgi:hypothetical protein
LGRGLDAGVDVDRGQVSLDWPMATPALIGMSSITR